MEIKSHFRRENLLYMDMSYLRSQITDFTLSFIYFFMKKFVYNLINDHEYNLFTVLIFDTLVISQKQNDS